MMSQASPRLLVLLSALLIGLVACDGGSDVADNTPAPSNNGNSNNGHGTGPKTDITVDQEAFLLAYEEVRAEAESMTPQDFQNRYQAPAPVSNLSYDPLTASELDAIAAFRPISQPQREALADNGFVVLEDADAYTFENAYSDLYYGDMPVLITTDSILYAMHRSYSRILQTLERQALVAALDRMLTKLHDGLRGVALDASQQGAARDVDIYLSVGRTLLTGERPASVTEGVEEEITKILDAAEGQQPGNLSLFGVDAIYDYSQLKPRGHYTDDPVLQRYFKAMMWVGRTELPLIVFPEGEPVFNREAVNAAMLLNVLMADTGARSEWGTLDAVIRAMVGDPDSMTPTDMDRFMDSESIASMQDLAALTDDQLQQALLAKPYGIQRIMSQIIYTDPHNPQVVLPRVYLLMGQRFVLDSYVFHNVTFDRLRDPKTGDGITRMLPSGLDIQFALGSNAAGELLQDEIDAYGYQGTLHELRYLTESHPEDFWKANLYNTWLDTLRSLNDDSDRAMRPEAMRTRAWDHKTLNTQLASWAELRHDTILYAKQSYSGGVGCEYPTAYVEPYPTFFAKLQVLADRGVAMTDALNAAGIPVDSVKDYFENFGGVAATLESIAKKELAQEPLTEDEWNFLRATIEREMVGCGETRFDGWYPSLFFSVEDLADFKPTIADVHTAPTDKFGNEKGWVLHGATGPAKYMVFTLNTCEGTQAYIGPVSTYYDVLTENYQRLDNETWLNQVYQGQAIRPAWTSSFAR